MAIVEKKSLQLKGAQLEQEIIYPCINCCF